MSLKGAAIIVTAWFGNRGRKILFSGTQKKCFVTVGVFFAPCKNGISNKPAAFVGIPSAECFRVASFHLFSGQLLIQFGDVVVPLGLVAGSRHRSSQVVFLPEALDLKLATAVSRSVCKDSL